MAKTTLTERIDHAMTARGMNASMLADRVGVSRSAVSQWRSGDTVPNAENLIHMSKALQVAPEWLILGTGSMTSTDAAVSQIQVEAVEDKLKAHLVRTVLRAAAKSLGYVVKHEITTYDALTLTLTPERPPLVSPDVVLPQDLAIPTPKRNPARRRSAKNDQKGKSDKIA